MSGKYILDGDTPVPTDDLLAWAEWYETADRIVARTQVDTDVTVSTVFLALDHGHHGGPALLYETMIFGGRHDQYMSRYHDREAALAGHDRAVRRALGAPLAG